MKDIMELCIKNTIVLCCFVPSHKNLISRALQLVCFNFPKKVSGLLALCLFINCAYICCCSTSFPVPLFPLFPCVLCSLFFAVLLVPLVLLFSTGPRRSTCLPLSCTKGNHDFSEKIMALTFYLVAYPFLRGKRQFTRIYGSAHG